MSDDDKISVAFECPVDPEYAKHVQIAAEYWYANLSEDDIAAIQRTLDEHHRVMLTGGGTPAVE